MAANLTPLANGRVAFVYNKQTVGVPWHGTGDPKEGPFSIPGAVKEIGADFQARATAIKRDGTNTKIPGWKEISHPNGSTYQVVTDTYEVVQYSDLADAFALAAGETPDTPRGNTMGMLGEDMGQFFVTCESGLVKIDKRNEINRFLCFLTGHRLVSSQIFGTDTNIVCENTLRVAVAGSKEGKSRVAIPHKTGANRRIELMAGMIAVAQSVDAKALEAYVALAETMVNRQVVEDYSVALFPHDKEKGPTPDRILDKRLSVEQAFAHPVVNGTKTGSDGRSAFGLYNAATWQIDQGQAKGDWVRTQFSPACQESRTRAFDLALALVRS